jgi:nucleoside-diphosphate-sugar epimerase
MTRPGERAGIIVTGGSGYIGQEVVRAALNRHDACYRGGHRVVNIDLRPPHPLHLRLQESGRYHDVNADPRAHFIEADVSDPGPAARALDDAISWLGEPAAVCHLVGLVKFGQPDERLYRPNVKSVENMARECAERKLFFTLFSGTAVHGDRLRGKIKETDPVSPIESYGRSKAEAERIVFDHVANAGLRAIVFRATNPIGPALQTSELNKLYESAMKDPLMAAVKGSRSTYVSTEDVGRVLVYAAENVDTVFPEAPRGLSDVVYNLGAGDGLSDAEVAAHLLESIHGRVKKPIVELNVNVVVGFSYLFTAAASLLARVRSRQVDPIVHHELAKLFRGSHDQDQTKFRSVFEANGFRLKNDTPGSALDVGTVWKFLTDWADRPRPQRIATLAESFLEARSSSSY